MSTGPYPTLMSPVKVGHTVLKNRVIMGGMHTRIEMSENAAERLAAFYGARARGGVGLIITGGYSPNAAGGYDADGPFLMTRQQAAELEQVTEVVHAEGAKICLQISHTGRSARHDGLVAPSEIRSPINRFTPRALSHADILETIDDFANCARLARGAGFDGVEIIGSGGYLLSEFTTRRANMRDDDWGGSVENRHRLPVEIVRRIRSEQGPEFLITYRIGAADLVEDGQTGDEIDQLAAALTDAGVDLFTGYVGWHESRIPTVAYPVPRAAFTYAIERLKRGLKVPVAACNRINMPQVAEDILSRGAADMVYISRPFLADPDFVAKARDGRTGAINTCIACNQLCLDHIMTDREAGCLVNPAAARETLFDVTPATRPRKIAVVGGGPAGLSCAITAAARGHDVTLFEAADTIGGQINLACAVPGKTEYKELLRYYQNRLETTGVTVRTGTIFDATILGEQGFDAIVVASGVTPRLPDLPGIAGDPRVVTYDELLTGRAKAGHRVAIIGMGGIGFDVAKFLSIPQEVTTVPAVFQAYYGLDPTLHEAGGLLGAALSFPPARHQITMLQRKVGRPGATLGVSTGWIGRGFLQRQGVEMRTGVTYRRLDSDGLHIEQDGKPEVIALDTLVICAGQNPNPVHTPDDLPVHLIGGAHRATELDAARAIEEGWRLGLAL
ncbi:2,4-dienoyl-CoA reductase (NADPH2) [Rhodobacteraceae bacterium MBR-64]